MSSNKKTNPKLRYGLVSTQKNNNFYHNPTRARHKSLDQQATSLAGLGNTNHQPTDHTSLLLENSFLEDEKLNEIENYLSKSKLQICFHISTQKVIYGIVILGCLFRTYDFWYLKQQLHADLDNNFYTRKYEILDLFYEPSTRSPNFDPHTFSTGTLSNTLSVNFTEISLKLNQYLTRSNFHLSINLKSFVSEKEQPFLNFFYATFITNLSLIICYWSEFYFSSEFANLVENKKITGIFLRKSSIAFIIFNSCLYLFIMSQFIFRMFIDLVDGYSRKFIHVNSGLLELEVNQNDLDPFPNNVTQNFIAPISTYNQTC